MNEWKFISFIHGSWSSFPMACACSTWCKWQLPVLFKQSGTFYSVSNSWLHIVTESWWNAQMVSCSIFSLHSFSMEPIIQRSILGFVLMRELTIPPCRTILACIKYLRHYPCPCCLIFKGDISKLGTKHDCKLRDSKERVDDEIQQSKIWLVWDWIYKGGSGIVSAAVERILNPKSLIPMQVSLTLVILDWNIFTQS